MTGQQLIAIIQELGPEKEVWIEDYEYVFSGVTSAYLAKQDTSTTTEETVPEGAICLGNDTSLYGKTDSYRH